MLQDSSWTATMRLGTLLAAVVLTACVLTEINCITNQEFFDLVKDYAEDIESFDLDDPAIKDDDDDDNVIDLPGNADDELDIEYLLTKLDLTDMMQSLEKAPPKEPNTNLGWWRRRRRRRRRRPWRNPCSCRGTHCSCCIAKTFRINLWFKKWRYRVSVCVNVGYIRRDHGFYFTIKLNGRSVFHREVSVRRPPALCYGVPGLRRFVRACIELYNVNIRAKSMCLRVAIVIDVKIKKFRYSLKLGCFRIPILDELSGQDATKLLESMEATVENKETGQIEEVSLADLPTLYRQLQIETAQKYMEQENESESGETQGLFLEPEEMK